MMACLVGEDGLTFVCRRARRRKVGTRGMVEECLGAGDCQEEALMKVLKIFH